MENEGIMGLPEGQAMQDPESSQALPAVSSADSYDAALTALGATNPGQLDVYKRAIRQEIQALDLSPAEISALVEMLEYMSQRPAEYPQLRQSLIEQDIIDAEDLPEQYDPSFIGAMLAVLSEMEMARGQGAMAPMEMGPDMAELPPMGFAEGGLADAAQYLASKGRRGDTMLAHITPAEARMLSAMGGSATINPDTGLPEFFLKKIFKGIKKAFKSIGKAVKKVLKSPIGKIVGTIALALVLGPTAIGATLGKAGTAALASGATTLAAGGNIKDALISSAMGYFGGGGTIFGESPVSAIAGRVGQFLPGGAEGALAQGIGTGVTGTGVGLVAGMSPEEALKMGATQGVITGGTQAFQNWLASRQPPPAEPPVAPVEEVGTAQEQPGAEAPAPGAEAQPPAQPAAAPATTAPTTPAPRALDTVAALNRLSDTELMIEGYQPFEIAQIRSGTFAGSFPTSPVINQAVGAAPTGGGYIDRLGQLVRQPSFENLGNLLVDKTATTTVGKYGPGVATALGATALMGGFKGQPVDEAPLFERGYTGSDFIRDNPELFQGSFAPPKFEPYDPVVPTPSYGMMPVTQPTTVVPTGITQNPQGVVQPYNVEGLYGVPLIYPTPPRGYARGGEATSQDPTDPEYIFQDFLRANPGRDPGFLRQAAEERSQLLRSRQGTTAPSVGTPPPAIATPSVGAAPSTAASRQDPTDPEYIFQEFVRANPGRDPEFLRQAAQDRSQRLREARGLPPFPVSIPSPVALPATDVADRVYGKFEDISSQLPSFDTGYQGPSMSSFPSYVPPSFSAAGARVPTFGGFSIPQVYAPSFDFSNIGNLSSGYNVPQLAPIRFLAEGGEADKPSAMSEFNDRLYRMREARGQSLPEYLIPNPLNSLRALANLPEALTRKVPGPNVPGSYGYKPSPVPRDAFGGPGVPFSQAGYGNMYTSGFDPTTGGTYDPGSELVPADLPPGGFAQGGFVPPTGYAGGGQPTHFPRKNGPINGPGTGTSDSIPAMLSDGEFVFTAKAVRNAGGGSRRKGAKRMYSLMKKLEGGPVEA